MLDEIAMKRLGFAAEDLAMARDGLLSENQKRRIGRASVLDGTILLAISAVPLVSLLFFRNSMDGSDTALAWIIFLFLAALSIGGMVQTRKAIRQGKVERIQGKIKTRTSWRGVVFLRIRDKEFVANRAVFGLSHGEEYIVYYTRSAHTLIAIERAI